MLMLLLHRGGCIIVVLKVKGNHQNLNIQIQFQYTPKSIPIHQDDDL